MPGKPRNNHNPRCLALGRNIKRLREKRGLTQEALSEKADIHVSYIGR
jgi:transcriptional regulator with XRE-family HTH domain